MDDERISCISDYGVNYLKNFAIQKKLNNIMKLEFLNSFKIDQSQVIISAANQG